MRKDFGAKTWLFPMPVLIVAAYDADGVPNAMNAAWGGIYTDDMVGICLSENHKTTRNILKTGAFTVSPATADAIVECDYVGIVSGNKVPDKLSRAGITVKKAQSVNAPIIEQLPVALECELVSYDEESCYMVGRIVNVSAVNDVLDAEGNISLGKVKPVVYDPISHDYLAVSDKVADAFVVGKRLKG